MECRPPETELYPRRRRLFIRTRTARCYRRSMSCTFLHTHTPLPALCSGHYIISSTRKARCRCNRCSMSHPCLCAKRQESNAKRNTPKPGERRALRVLFKNDHVLLTHATKLLFPSHTCLHSFIKKTLPSTFTRNDSRSIMGYVLGLRVRWVQGCVARHRCCRYCMA